MNNFEAMMNAYYTINESRADLAGFAALMQMVKANQ